MNDETLAAPFTAFLSEASFSKPHRLSESAWTQHVPFAFWLVEQLKPKLLVELGVHTGMSYFAFCQSVKTNFLPTLCYGIDTWKGDAHAGLYNDAVWHDVSGYNAQEYASFSYLLKTTFAEALPYFEPQSIDLLHIDGLHTYEAVKEDFESWLPKMTAGGIVVLHDIVVREREFGVCKFWAELKQQYKSFEFLHGHGLGIVALGDVASEKLSRLFDLADDSEISKIRAVYAGLGIRQAESYNTHVLETNLAHVIGLHDSLQAQIQELKAQYDLLHTEHADLKKLVSEQQPVTAALEPAIIPAVVPPGTEV